MSRQRNPLVLVNYLSNLLSREERQKFLRYNLLIKKENMPMGPRHATNFNLKIGGFFFTIFFLKKFYLFCQILLKIKRKSQFELLLKHDHKLMSSYQEKKTCMQTKKHAWVLYAYKENILFINTLIYNKILYFVWCTSNDQQDYFGYIMIISTTLILSTQILISFRHSEICLDIKIYVK